MNPASVIWPLYVDPEPVQTVSAQRTARTRRLEREEPIEILNP